MLWDYSRPSSVSYNIFPYSNWKFSYLFCQARHVLLRMLCLNLFAFLLFQWFFQFQFLSFLMPTFRDVKSLVSRESYIKITKLSLIFSKHSTYTYMIISKSKMYNAEIWYALKNFDYDPLISKVFVGLPRSLIASLSGIKFHSLSQDHDRR